MTEDGDYFGAMGGCMLLLRDGMADLYRPLYMYEGLRKILK